MDEVEDVYLACLNFAKTFDTINQRSMLTKGLRSTLDFISVILGFPFKPNTYGLSKRGVIF